MILFIGALVALFLLFLLYRFLPRRTYFFGFLLLLVLASVVTHHLTARPAAPPPMTEEDQAALARQQEIYTAWDAKYQKELDALDRNWQWYHQILEDFKEDSIDLQTVNVRLTQLENDSLQAKKQADELAPPMELSTPAYDLVTSICQKTAAYADAQYKAIALTRAACDPKYMKVSTQEAQSRVLQSVMNRESPSALFIADEMAQLHTLLATPRDEAETK